MITGDFPNTARAIAEAIGLLRPGNAFTQAEWDAAKNDALRRLTDRRYPAGRISASQAEVDPATATVRLSLTLDSGPRYRIGALQVEGSDRYDPALVSRLARLSPGANAGTAYRFPLTIHYSPFTIRCSQFTVHPFAGVLKPMSTVTQSDIRRP